jgi:ABC-type nitrate/sulfonate/bicarbonate transport system permease component
MGHTLGDATWVWIGTTLGVLLAVGIVYTARWIIRDAVSTSQTIPILALAPMIMCWVRSGFRDFCQNQTISAYLRLFLLSSAWSGFAG